MNTKKMFSVLVSTMVFTWDCFGMEGVIAQSDDSSSSSSIREQKISKPIKLHDISEKTKLKMTPEVQAYLKSIDALSKTGNRSKKINVDMMKSAICESLNKHYLVLTQHDRRTDYTEYSQEIVNFFLENTKKYKADQSIKKLRTIMMRITSPYNEMLNFNDYSDLGIDECTLSKVNIW